MAKARTKGHSRRQGRSEPIKIELSAYANEVQEREGMLNQLKLFYQAAMGSQIGFAVAKNKDGFEVPIIVGIERRITGTDVLYPIATLIDAEELSGWSLPDGEGGYVQFSEAA